MSPTLLCEGVQCIMCGSGSSVAARRGGEGPLCGFACAWRARRIARWQPLSDSGREEAATERVSSECLLLSAPPWACAPAAHRSLLGPRSDESRRVEVHGGEERSWDE